MPLNRCGSVSARFERVILSASASAKTGRLASSTSRPPGLCRASASTALHNIQRRLPLRARLGNNQRAMSRSRWRAGQPCRESAPQAASSETARQSSSERRGTARLAARRRLVYPGDAKRRSCRPSNRVERRIDGAQQKRGHQPNVLDRVADDARAKRVEIELDIRELGHAQDSLAAGSGDVRARRELVSTKEAARRDMPRGSGLRDNWTTVRLLGPAAYAMRRRSAARPNRPIPSSESVAGSGTVENPPKSETCEIAPAPARSRSD